MKIFRTLPKRYQIGLLFLLVTAFAVAKLSLDRTPPVPEIAGPQRNAQPASSDAPLVNENTIDQTSQPPAAFEPTAPTNSANETPGKAAESEGPGAAEVIASEPSPSESDHFAEPPREVASEATTDATFEVASSDEEIFPKFWISAGVGANYTQINESNSQLNANYPGLSAPSFALEVGLGLTTSTAIGASYKSTPANGKNKEQLHADLSYDWKTVGVEAVTTVSRASQAQRSSDWKLLYGFQYHSLPVITYDLATLTPNVQEAQMLNFSLGVKYQYYVNPRQFYTVSGRFQYPLSSSSATIESFRLESPVIFDGSVGGEYRITDSLWGGLYWYGQYHSFKFSQSNSASVQQSSQKMIYSNIELRMTFRF